MRSAGLRQLNFAFADSPRGGKDVEPPGEPDGKAYLLHTAKGTKAEGPAAGEVDPDQLMEQMTAPANLATALLNVAKNKGAPGVDGRSVEEVVGERRRLGIVGPEVAVERPHLEAVVDEPER